jgi:hypothetical protein
MDPRYYAFAQLWDLQRYDRLQPTHVAGPARQRIRPRIGGMLVRLGSRMAGQPMILQGGHQ